MPEVAFRDAVPPGADRVLPDARPLRRREPGSRALSAASTTTSSADLQAAAEVAAARQLLVDNLDEIRQIVEVTCGPGFAHEADDCLAWVLIRLVDDDYLRLRKFRGEAPGRLFLRTVVLRLVRDYRILVWGKWQPSERARQLGVAAMRLERLIWRDGHAIDDAVAIVAQSTGADPGELREVVAELPVRPRRRFVAQSQAGDIESTGGVERRLIDARREEVERELKRHLREILGELDPTMRRLLRRHYRDGEKIRTLAREAGVSDGSFYARLRRCLQGVRAELRRRGVEASALEDLRWNDLELSFSSLLEDSSTHP